MEAEIEQIEEKVVQPVERSTLNVQPPTSNQPLKLGERVTVSTLQAEGVVTALGESDAEVQVGSLRVRAKLSDLVRKSSQPSDVNDQPETTYSPSSPAGTSSPGIELDLRGQASDDALDLLDRYLDQAFSAKLPFVRIIHGKGTGKLREVVRSALRRNSHVASFEEGGPKEGGEGVTVATMK